jgi:hypothetical protein
MVQQGCSSYIQKDTRIILRRSNDISFIKFSNNKTLDCFTIAESPLKRLSRVPV